MDIDLIKNQWVWSKILNEPVKILEENNKWEFNSYRVWSPSENKTLIHSSEQIDLISNSKYPIEFLRYIVATARIYQVYATEPIVSPLQGNLIPLPHQLTALKKIVKDISKVRFLLADEVGLGKTIEAGLVLKEMKIRDKIKRILILSPRGLIIQWIYEMKNRFDEDFQLIEPNDYAIFEDNYWKRFDQVITTIDSVKPLSVRKGWNQNKIEKYNEKRYNNLLLAGWDLVIVDESHKLGGTTKSVARYKLGKGLSESTPHFLLLSATPHQGNREQFHRLISLLDPKAFPTPDFLSKESVSPFIVRTEKRKALDIDGKMLFTKRTTKLKNIIWTEKYEKQKLLYERVTDYVINGYNQARLENRQYLGFLMILMQRLVTSSTRAIKSALEKRLQVLESEGKQKENEIVDDWDEKDGQMQLDEIFDKFLNSLNNEKKTVQELLSIARKCEVEGPDIKAEHLLELLIHTQSEENDPKTKFLIFTEFTSTQKMLLEFLSSRGYEPVILNGSMNMQQRTKSQDDFAKNAQILISTEAGGEGLNLQFCHNVINYDLPWNPMRIEQRIGRVDRIGQKLPVKAYNLALKETVETRVMEVLESKLAIILTDLGVDKLSDVLDSTEADLDFNKLYIHSLEEPDKIDETVDTFLSAIKDKISNESNDRKLITPEQELDIETANTVDKHPLPIWVETMVSNYLVQNNGQLIEKTLGFDIKWPDGRVTNSVTFDKKQSESGKLKFLSLEDYHVRKISKYLGTFVKNQNIPKLVIPNLSKGICGIWSIWRVGISGNKKNNIIFPIFIHDDGRKLRPTAFHIWDMILEKNNPIHLDYTYQDNYSEIFEISEKFASEEGKISFDKLKNEIQINLKNEKEKMDMFFEHKYKMIQKIGLENVRKKRLSDLNNEKKKFEIEIKKLHDIFPEFNAVIMLHVEGSKNA